MSRTHTAFTTLALLAASAAAGPIDPPAGPVESTMKPLTEVEPRIAINQTNTPGDSDAAFVIDQPGSYYLTQNLIISGLFDFPSGTITPRDGIRIEASNVSIDLNGFTLRGGLFDPRNGITTDPAVEVNGILIQNGFITGFRQDGVDVSDQRLDPDRSRGLGLVRRVHAMDNRDNGIFGRNLTVEHCQASNNGEDGINAAVVSYSQASNNSDFGIIASSAYNCSSNDNRVGYSIQDGTAEGCTAEGNAGDGYNVAFSTITRCSATRNGGSGFSLFLSSIRDSVATANSQSGFLANSIGNTTEKCLSQSNKFGFKADIADSSFYANTASGNTTNWSIAGGNMCHVIMMPQMAPTVGDTGGSPVNQSPWVNFTR